MWTDVLHLRLLQDSVGVNLDSFLALPRRGRRVREECFERCIEPISILPLLLEMTHVTDKGITRYLLCFLLAPILDQEPVYGLLEERVDITQDGPVFEGENV